MDRNKIKIERLYYTLKSLKFIQIIYLIKYRIFNLSTKYSLDLSKEIKTNKIVLSNYITKFNSLIKNEFKFINISHRFNENNIDWNYTDNGMLWAYNLNYMDFLNQANINKSHSISLIHDYINKIQYSSIGLDAYPISLRCINWIKFISKENINCHKINSSLKAQYNILQKKIEYHLLANHLIENGFSLLFGAFYFNDLILYRKANRILIKELKEQILPDGGHIELSPMYHQIILDRLLDCTNLLKNNRIFDDQNNLLDLMVYKANLMLSWINSITFKNGKIPLLNDSTINISPSTSDLNKYATTLGIHIYINKKLKESGYRKIENNNYECIIDIGDIKPRYQPGHSHADTFNFVVNINNTSFIIDPGISTYNNDLNRSKERSTFYHNTVNVNNTNSSDVWSSFRVGKKASVTIIKDFPNLVVASHNGYSKFGVSHIREWAFNLDTINITDFLDKEGFVGKLNIFFAPHIKIELIDNSIITNEAIIEFNNYVSIEIISKRIPDGYNKYYNTNTAEVSFSNKLNTNIKILKK